MKKILFIIVCLMAMVTFVSCSSAEDKIQSNLEELVIEKGVGLVKKCNTISMEIDTIRISDIKAFVANIFPDGIPDDYNDKEFQNFISPLKSANDDGSIAYLSVTHKYKAYLLFDPLGRDEAIITQYRLVNPSTYEYISDDLTKDDTWISPWLYKYHKETQELLSAYGY